MRDSLLPYGRQTLAQEDVDAVVAVLRSDWLTTGPEIPRLEEDFAEAVGTAEAVAVSSGTAALHAAMAALGIGPGDEVIVPPLTFAASANCVLYQGGVPVFADVEADTLLLDADRAAEHVTPRTKAIIAVDYAGQPCDYGRLRALAHENGLALVADGCHALGATYGGRAVGSLADLTVFSMHPVKHITSGEGGMITTDRPELAAAMRRFRSHGITSDARLREQRGTWRYDMVELGYNYRLTDFQSALARTQLRHLDEWLERRRAIARSYDRAFAAMPGIDPLVRHADREHAYHLYVIRVPTDQDRGEVYRALRAEGIGVAVHYPPVHLHSYYRQTRGTSEGSYPVAEAAYDRILSLPIFPAMSDGDVEDVVRAVEKVWKAWIRT